MKKTIELMLKRQHGRSNRFGILLVSIALSVFCMMLSGCSKTETITVTSPPQSSTSTTLSSTNTGQNHQIEMLSVGFSPQKIIVKRKEAITWVNNDSNSHTVTSWNHYQGNDGWMYTEIGKEWDSGDITPGNTFTLTFQETGTYEYTSFSMYIYNTFQSQTIGEIVVTE